MKTQEEISIPLRTSLDTQLISDQLTKAILSNIRHDWIRFEEIRNGVESQGTSKPQKKTLAHALKELQWLGCIEIRNSEEDAKHWQVKRTES